MMGLPAKGKSVSRAVALHAERAAEEAAGTVRWLRPEFQAPEETRRRVRLPPLPAAQRARGHAATCSGAPAAEPSL